MILKRRLLFVLSSEAVAAVAVGVSLPKMKIVITEEVGNIVVLESPATEEGDQVIEMMIEISVFPW